MLPKKQRNTKKIFIKINYFFIILLITLSINTNNQEIINKLVKKLNYNEIINNKYYNKNTTKEYINIEHSQNKLFLSNVSSLLNKGYTSNDINIIYQNINVKSINILLNNKYIKNIATLISSNNFKEENLERYIKYYQKDINNIKTVVTYVNIGLDNKYYTNITNIKDEENIEVLVNKYHKLSENYEPRDLTTISPTYGTGKLRKTAKIAFEEMCKKAKKDNIIIYSGSAYRSYNYQLNLYNRYANIDGINKTDTYTARAGHSEHQTGLALDILNKNQDYISDTDKEYTWLINNSYKYGFILRYPKEKEHITGYIYEPWHYRYLGIELATEITNLNITYEEYIAKSS